MEQLVEYSKELVDRFIRSMGYDPKHVDKDKRMAFTKTLRFQQFAQRLGEETEEVNEQSPESVTMKNRPYTKGLAQSRAHTKDMALKRSVHVNKPQLPVTTESHMGEIHSDLGDLLDKHIEKYKSMGGAENLAHHTSKASSKLAKLHGISPEHATKFANDYVDNKLSESVDRQLSKTASLIKSIYKEHRLKEEIYDHEKDDKDGTTYGKKPKLSTNDEESELDKKTQATAVLSGGTTLTGQGRDTVEIDPVLKKSKPGSPNGEVGDTKQ